MDSYGAETIVPHDSGPYGRDIDSCVDWTGLGSSLETEKGTINMEINGQSVSESKRYDQMGLSPELMRAIEKKGYVQATAFQTGSIPYFME